MPLLLTELTSDEKGGSDVFHILPLCFHFPVSLRILSDKTLLESEKFNLEKLNVLPRSKSRLRSFQRPGSTKLFGYMFSNLATRQPSYLPYVSICETRFIW